MDKIKINNLIEYLPPIFIISYFVFHNILLVLIGTTFSLYLININFINKLARNINKKLISLYLFRVVNQNDKSIKADSILMKTEKKESKFKLVEEIEELGFIPSADKHDDIHVA